jgi:S-DNA-T family DNA segregation ATPase FtsK/SpoIIIE
MARRNSGYPPRRRRGFGRRNEPVPLYVYPDNEPAAFLYALGAILRAGWRYRSELAPAYCTAGVMIAGAWLHSVHPAWWPVPAVLGGSAVLAVLVWAVPGRCARRVRARLAGWWLRRAGARLLTRWPVLAQSGVRRWLLAVCAGAGGWLTAATITGVAAGPLRGLAVLGMLGLGAPWWWSQDRRRLVRIRRVMERFPDTADAAGLPGTAMVSAEIGGYGWTARLKLRRGQHAGNATDAIPALESALGTRVGALRIEPVPSDAAEVILRVVEVDPHAYPIPWPGAHPGSQSGRARSIGDPVRVGMWEDGEPVRVPLLRRHVLIGGTTGSGKSGLLNVILAELAACRDVVLWGVDLKGGTELTPWRGCLARTARSKPDATDLLRAAVTELERRAEYMAAHGLREWTPTASAPALVVVVDEYAELTPEARRVADSIARRGRAVAVTLLVATQRPTMKAMGEGSAIRSQMDVRFCFRVRERGDVDLIIGQGAYGAGWDATALDAPGKFLLSAPGHDAPRRGRVYLITDDQVQTVAARHARPQDQSAAPGKEDQPNETHSRDGAADGADHGPLNLTAGGGDDRDDGAPVSGDVALWAALRAAGDDGLTIAQLMDATGRSRAWVYGRVRDHDRDGRITRTARGRWRATPARAGGGDS